MTTSEVPPDAVLLTAEQVCAMTGIADRTLRRYVSSGQFPKPRRLPNRDPLRAQKRWTRNEVEEWMRQLPQAED